MANRKAIEKKANAYFYGKVIINILLMVLGSVLIGLFLSGLQERRALAKQHENSVDSLSEVVGQLRTNEDEAVDLTTVFHDGNQDMVEDLRELFTSGMFDSLQETDEKTLAGIFSDMADRSGMDYLFITGEDGTIYLSSRQEYIGQKLAETGLLSGGNMKALIRGTAGEDGTITPVQEDNESGRFYFYSAQRSYGGSKFTLVMGTEMSALDAQLDSLRDLSGVLGRSLVRNNGFMFAVDRQEGRFLYYQSEEEELTGEDVFQAGLTKEALVERYAGVQTINGNEYYCVSEPLDDRTTIFAAAEIREIFRDNRYVLFWSILGFVLVMIISLTYAVIVRNDFVRRTVRTDKKQLFKFGDSALNLDRSVFRKIFPLMAVGVILIFGISYYTQTLLEISETVDNVQIALAEAAARYEEGTGSREVIEGYYNDRYLAKARLISFLVEEDPSALNADTDRQYSAYDDKGEKYYLQDNEGNVLRSVGSSARLQELCDRNNLKSIYVYDDCGRTIATSTPNWFFTISHDEKDQSYPFLQVVDGKIDSFVQDPMTSDLGEEGQFVGVAFNYYTKKDKRGDTVYVSRLEYEESLGKTGTGKKSEDAAQITEHHSMLQVQLDSELTERVLASTGLESILSSNMLKGGYMVLYDDSEDHICQYSPYEARVGKKAADLGVPENAFSGDDYYGFFRVNGRTWFRYFRYNDGYFLEAAVPEEGMFGARLEVSVLTAVTSLILLLILSATVTLTTKEEEILYSSMSGSRGHTRIGRAIFNVILPSGDTVSTVSASSRWDNRGIPWREKTPEQKLLTLIGIAASLLFLYVAVSALSPNSFLREESVITYILSGNWEKGLNVFALSACMLVLILTFIVVSLARIPISLFASLLGARGETIGHLLVSVLKYGSAIGALFYGIHLFGVDSTSLLASAGLLSLIIGLGAQSLIKDILAGIFIVFEGEFRVGDIVTIGGFRGTVMDIGLRTTKVLGSDGNVKIFNNSEISGVLNMTKDMSVATCTIDIEYGQDLDFVEEVLGKELPALKKNNRAILDGPNYLGVKELGDSGVRLLIIASCNEADIKGVIRYMNKEILQIFYRNGINVPFPNVTVSMLSDQKHDEEGRAGAGPDEEGPEKEDQKPVKKDDGLFQ